MLYQTYPFVLPPLPYAYDAMEPYIDTETMYYHHDAHFRAYIDNLNSSLIGNPRLMNMTLKDLLQLPLGVPPALAETILFNAGGVYNHDFFFKHLSPISGCVQKGLSDDIKKCFGSIDTFETMFLDVSSKLKGSGWTCLKCNSGGKLKIVNLKNQECVVTTRDRPLLLLDVWEHAYYLKYRNERAKYAKTIMSNILLA